MIKNNALKDIKKSSKKNDKNWRDTLSRLIPFIDGHKFTIFFVILLLLINAGMVISVGFAVNYVIDNIPTDAVEAEQFFNKVLYVALGIILFGAVVRFLHSYLLAKIATSITQDIRCKVFNNITDQGLEYFDKQHSGDMQTRIIADINVVGQLISTQIPINLSSLVRLIGGLVGAVLVSVKMTVAVLVALPLLFLPFFILAKPIRRLSKQLQKSVSDLGMFAGESFRNVKIIQAYNKKNNEKARFKGLAKGVVTIALRRARYDYLVSAAVNALALSGAVLLLWGSARDISQGMMSVGQLASLGYFVFMVVTAASQFINTISSLNSALGSADKISQYLSLEKYTWSSTIQEFNGEGDIRYQQVKFNYPNRPDIQVLHGIDLTIEAGSQVVIVGPSGAGKSTLFELLLRFYELDKGSISIGGNNIKDLDIELGRKFIGLVPQKENLVSGTVLDNICYGLDEIDEETAMTYAKKVKIDDFIKRLPNGYHTDIGEVGGRLSGGQKQRISLARAMANNPRILLLDEANSALDVETDRYIAKSIKEWAAEHSATVITIAHRLETARNAQRIIVMEDGAIIGDGTHEQLMITCPVYCQLAKELQTTVDAPEPVLEEATV